MGFIRTQMVLIFLKIREGSMNVDIRYNKKNNVWIRVNYDSNDITIVDGDTLSVLDWEWGYGKKGGKRRYPAVRMPKTGRLMHVHRLIAYTYLMDEFRRRVAKNGSYERLVVDHIDNNPMNPMPTNLRWCTQSENMRYRATQPKYIPE